MVVGLHHIGTPLRDGVPFQIFCTTSPEREHAPALEFATGAFFQNKCENIIIFISVNEVEKSLSKSENKLRSLNLLFSVFDLVYVHPVCVIFIAT